MSNKKNNKPQRALKAFKINKNQILVKSQKKVLKMNNKKNRKLKRMINNKSEVRKVSRAKSRIKANKNKQYKTILKMQKKTGKEKIVKN